MAERRARPEELTRTSQQRGSAENSATSNILHQTATTSIDSVTLRMKPAGFQFGVSGCATPLLLVHRTNKSYLPGAGSVNWVCHCRNPYLPSSFSSCA